MDRFSRKIDNFPALAEDASIDEVNAYIEKVDKLEADSQIEYLDNLELIQNRSDPMKNEERRYESPAQLKKRIYGLLLKLNPKNAKNQVLGDYVSKLGNKEKLEFVDNYLN